MSIITASGHETLASRLPFNLLQLDVRLDIRIPAVLRVLLLTPLKVLLVGLGFCRLVVPNAVLVFHIPLVLVKSAQHKHHVHLQGEVDQRPCDQSGYGDHPQVVLALIHRFKDQSVVRGRIFLKVFTYFRKNVEQNQVYYDKGDQLDEVQDQNQRVGKPEAPTHLFAKWAAKSRQEEKKEQALEGHVDPLFYKEGSNSLKHHKDTDGDGSRPQWDTATAVLHSARASFVLFLVKLFLFVVISDLGQDVWV